jgi:predicted DNA-binding transcriptional regulator YafY
MSRDEDKLIRQLSLLSFLLSQPRPFTAREIQDSVEGYWDMSDETFARRFHGDRADLGRIGIDIHSSSQGDAADTQVYFLPEEEYRLPSVEFTPAEQRSLAVALAALDGRFAYARPLRLALTAISQGLPNPIHNELEQLPVALAPDEDARDAGRQLARLEDAVTRGKTVHFSYLPTNGAPEERRFDPYSLFLIQGRWYVVGFDHLREGIRTFRVTRISGTVRFVTEKTRDFTIPGDYDPDEYRARPPWLIGMIKGTATVKVDEDLAWWVSRLQPHVQWLRDDEAGCSYFSAPFADEDVLLSWAVGLGGCGELLDPPALRTKLAHSLARVKEAHAGDPSAEDRAVDSHCQTRTARAKASIRKIEPIAPEHLARAISLVQYLVDERTPVLVPWADLSEDLGLTRAEVEADLSLINLVNFGGGTYALVAEADDLGVTVTRDVMSGVFSKPARLSPLMTRALLLAFDLLGETIGMDNTESLASVREKVRLLAGSIPDAAGIVVDDLVHPSPDLFDVLNRSIRQHKVVEISYFTPTRGRLTNRRVEPYLLFRSRDGWYLEAFCLNADSQRTFRLEYIRGALATTDVFAPRSEVDLTPRLSGAAFPAGGSVSWASVRFTPRWRAYLDDRGIEYKAIAGGDLQGRIPYLDERWMIREVVCFLGDATLESPAAPRQGIQELSASLLRLYTDDTADGTGGPR